MKTLTHHDSFIFVFMFSITFPEYLEISNNTMKFHSNPIMSIVYYPFFPFSSDYPRIPFSTSITFINFSSSCLKRFLAVREPIRLTTHKTFVNISIFFGI